jgi:hypothetical protein
MLAGLMSLPRIWHKRRQVQALRTVSLAYIEQLLRESPEQ